MGCRAVSAGNWRTTAPHWNDTQLATELNRAWALRPHWKGADQYTYQDWTQFRAATLREARKRGLDLSVVELRT